MTKIILFLLLMLSLPSPALAQSCCNEAMKAFFKAEEEVEFRKTLATEIKQKYQDSGIGKVANEIAKQIAKEGVCSQIAEQGGALVEKILDGLEVEILGYPARKEEYIRFVETAAKKTCTQFDRL